MYLKFTLLILLTSQPALAGHFISTIHSVDPGVNNEPHLIKFDNSKVVFVNSEDEDFIKVLSTAKKSHLAIQVTHDDEHNLISASSIKATHEKRLYKYQVPSSFKPTVLNDYTSALNILDQMRSDYNNEGQCFSRAHVWAYEEYKRSGLQSMKLFLFFTNRYIRNYRFKWWFHVTPMTYVGNTMRTLDRRYAKGAYLTKTWTDIFIKSKRTCPLVNLYRSYSDNQESQDCYLIPVNMYFLIPRDIEIRDLMGREKESFIPYDVERSYQDAFNISTPEV